VSRHIRLIKRAAPPVPAPLDIAARRHGRSVVVSWRTAFPARRCFFFVFAGPSRHPRTDVSAVDSVRGRGRSHFRVRLRSGDGRPLRWARIEAASVDGGRAPKSVLVPVH
jgi:hypothetical protein